MGIIDILKKFCCGSTETEAIQVAPAPHKNHESHSRRNSLSNLEDLAQRVLQEAEHMKEEARAQDEELINSTDAILKFLPSRFIIPVIDAAAMIVNEEKKHRH